MILTYFSFLVCVFSPWGDGPEDLVYSAFFVGHRSGHGGWADPVVQPADQTVPGDVFRPLQRTLLHHPQNPAGERLSAAKRLWSLAPVT